MKLFLRTFTIVAASIAACWIPLSGRTNDTALEAAALAWDRGDYVTALQSYLKILDSADAAAALETIALQTGELFHTTEITTDGAAPAFSPDGRHFTYEAGAGLARTTRLFATANPAKPVAELQGFGVTFSPESAKLAYLKLTPSPALLEAQAALDKAGGGERQQRQAAVSRMIQRESRIVVRDLAGGAETVVDVGDLRKSALAFGAGGTIAFAGAAAEEATEIYLTTSAGARPLQTMSAGEKAPLAMNATGTALLISIRTPGAGGGRGGGGGQGGGGSFGIVQLSDRTSRMIAGTAPSFSADGNAFTYVAREGNDYRLVVEDVKDPSKAIVARKGAERIDAPALSPDGSRVVFQLLPKEDWELYVVNRDGTGEARVTREIQHDILPRFLDRTRVLAAIGEARHRRSHVYDLSSPTPWTTRVRVFHNNTVRTIAPEYAWVASTDGKKVLIVSERDGDTVSVERGVYLVDLDRKVTHAALRARVAANLAGEEALRAKGRRLFGPIAADVKKVTEQASVTRVFAYEKALFDFDSKHITRPGNKLASEYLFNKYKSFGYEPEYQWFAGRGALGGQTANVIATLKGTVHPELVYVVSSHYDSVAGGPGADDDTSGTAALLEAARILARTPQPATIVFASFTGEEAGLLGSREYVRRAVENKLKLVGALNNDMVGWANDHRLDNTIRYSNAGIRDVQHAAAMQFSNMVTYDALYYKSTDAAAYYEAYGDIVGGIGSYPVLGNPHYHQSHDLLDTINHQLVTEVAKTTAATLMLLASSPSRLTDLKVDSFTGGTAKVSWTPSPEKGVTGYIVAYGPPSSPEAQQLRVTQPTATVPKVAPGTVISVRAVNSKGLEGWDSARVTIK